MSIYPKIHAFCRGLFEKNPAKEARALYNKLDAVLGEIGGYSAVRDDMAAALDRASHGRLVRHFGNALTEIVDDLLSYDGLFCLPNFDWTETHPIAGYWHVSERCRAVLDHVNTWQTKPEVFIHPLNSMLCAYLDAMPRFNGAEEDLEIPSTLLHLINKPEALLDVLCGTALCDEWREAGLFHHLQERITENMIRATGGNPHDPDFKKPLVWPSASKLESREALVSAYVGKTPLIKLFGGSLPFQLPLSVRYEHHEIVAGSGHGKTQTMQFMLAKDIEAVATGGRSVIVIDSQGDLIRNISKLKVFAEGEPLHDRIVIIDPTDVEYPISLNLFDVGQQRLKGYKALERERLTNSIIELYDFVLGSLLSAEMTQKQNVIFRYVTRLMLHIPDATIQTLRELMEPKSEVKFAPYIQTLSGSAKHFFETEFGGSEFTQTRKQVLRRLWGILENQTFERMFSHPRSKVDLFTEMNAGKVILINTAKDLLKESGTEIFGRFFIALIMQAAQERAVLPEEERQPTIVYIDEAAEYFDKNFVTMLSTARKQKVAMVLAHQYLGQADPRILDALAANTSIKFAGGVSSKDSRQLAQMLMTTPEFIESQKKGSFAAYVRGVTDTAVPLSFPFGYLESLPQMSVREQQQLRQKMRNAYAVPLKEVEVPPPDDTPPSTHKDGFADDW